MESLLKDDVCNEESMKGMEAMLQSLTKMMGAAEAGDEKEDDDFNPAQMAEMMKAMGIEITTQP